MVVKTTFLNGNLDKNLYIAQLESSVVQDSKDKVRILKKSIYELK